MFENDFDCDNYEEVKFMAELDSVYENCKLNACEVDSFLEDIRSIASTLTGVDDEERQVFVRIM